MKKTSITLTVNGRRFDVDVEPRRTLVDVLRDDLGFTGTHAGCEHGVCGSCTIIVDGETIRSCLMFAIQADSSTIHTVEGLMDGGKLHVLQSAFIEQHALQCGFCTPGFLMLLAGGLEKRPDMKEAEIRELLASNICRCTGYENIVKAALIASERMRAKYA